MTIKFKYPIEKIRSDFPFLLKKVNGKTISYLDNATSSQKPISVINRELNFYKYEYSSVNRSLHKLGINATEKMEIVRNKISIFINAKSSKEIIFVSGSTEAINMVVNSYGYFFLNSGDNIIISEAEHHSNLLPWYILCKSKRIELRILKINNNGTLNIENLSNLINNKTRLLSISHISNVLGINNPIKKIIKKVKKFGIKVFIDGSQSIMHQKIDVQDLNCDFYTFSGHKMYGPCGTGVLYGKFNLLKKMHPYKLGGGIIKEIDIKKNIIIYNEIPWKFESGSQNISGIIGLGAAIEYILLIGIEIINLYESYLIKYILNKLNKLKNIYIYGSCTNKLSLVSFNIKECHSYDVSNLLDLYGIYIRSGHLCSIPLMKYYGVSSMCRISIGLYNNLKDIDKFIFGLKKVLNILNI